MPNTFVDPTQVTQVALAIIGDDLVHAATMNRDFEADFGGGKGSTVNARVPAILAANERALDATDAIVTEDISESSVPVTIDKHVYSAVIITDADLTLNIEDFTRQVLRPQVAAVVEGVESRAAAAMEALTADTDLSTGGAQAYDPSDPVAAFTAGRKKLRDLGVPSSDLFAAIGTKVYADLLNAGAITDASQSDSDQALRNAIAGRVRGFNTYESNRIAEDAIVLYHRAAFTIAVRAPAVPRGVAYGSSLADTGFAMRWLQDYDGNTLRDRSVVSTFLGVQSMQLPQRPDGTMVTPAIHIDAGPAETEPTARAAKGSKASA